MNLSQAAGVILGANIGTTVTSQLVSFNLSEVAPVFLMAGVIMVLFMNNPCLLYTSDAADEEDSVDLGDRRHIKKKKHLIEKKKKAENDECTNTRTHRYETQIKE